MTNRKLLMGIWDTKGCENEANFLNLEPGPAGKCPSRGIFLSDSTPYLRKGTPRNLAYDE